MSLLAVVYRPAVMETYPGETEEVLAHLTACKSHTRAVRRWLSEDSRLALRDAVYTTGTEQLMRDWDQIVEPLGREVWAPTTGSRRATG